MTIETILIVFYCNLHGDFFFADENNCPCCIDEWEDANPDDPEQEMVHCNAHDETFLVEENVCPSCHGEWEELTPDDPRIDEEMERRGKQS